MSYKSLEFNNLLFQSIGKYRLVYFSFLKYSDLHYDNDRNIPKKSFMKDPVPGAQDGIISYL